MSPPRDPSAAIPAERRLVERSATAWAHARLVGRPAVRPAGHAAERLRLSVRISGDPSADAVAAAFERALRRRGAWTVTATPAPGGIVVRCWSSRPLELVEALDVADAVRRGDTVPRTARWRVHVYR